MRFKVNNIVYNCNLIIINEGFFHIFKDDELLLVLPVEDIYSIVNLGRICVLKNMVDGNVFDILETVIINSYLYDKIEEIDFYDYLINYIKLNNKDIIIMEA